MNTAWAPRSEAWRYRWFDWICGIGLHYVLSWTLLVGSGLALIPAPAYAYSIKQLLLNRLDPNTEYRTIRTKNFDIHYATPLEKVARVVAATAEHARASIVESWGDDQLGRTHIVVVHRSDQARIFTFITPMRQIFFDIALPHRGIGLNDFGQWHEWLITHEYAHVAHLQRHSGAYRPLGWLFGRWVRPNMATPPWMKEGIAVWAESNLTSHGRGESSTYRMMMRAAVHEDVLRSPLFATPDTVGNFDNRTWPWAFRPYLFGYYLIRTLEQKSKNQGAKSSFINDLMHRTSETAPYALDHALALVSGLTYEQLWQETLTSIEHDATRELQALRRQGPFTRLEYLTDTGFLHFGVEVSADGRTMLASRESPNAENAILSFDIDGHKVSPPTVLVHRTTGYQSSFSSSGRFVVFDQIFRAHRHYLVSDLYIYDRKTSEIVTKSPLYRARDPDVHPDGQHIVFVVNEEGKNRLLMTDTAWQQAVDLLGDIGYRRISGPRFAPDGSTVVVSVHNETTGGEDLWLVASDATKVLVADGARNRDADFSADGRWLIYSSDRSGVYNIYAYDLHGGRLFKISHVVGGLFFPRLAPGDKYVYAVGYRARGYDVVRFAWDPSSWSEVTDMPAPRAFAPKIDLTAVPTTDQAAQDYSPGSELWPQTLSPSLLFRPDTYQIGGSVSATDPLFTHHYELALRYDRATDFPVGSFYYYNGSYRYAVDLSMSYDAFPVGDNDENRFRVLSGQLAAHIPLHRQGTHYYLRPAVWMQWVDFLGSSLFPGVSITAQYDTEFKQLGQSFAESGTLLEIGVRQTFPTRRESVFSTSLVTRVRTHLPIGWARHAVHLGLSAATFVAGREDPNALFYAGGQLSFPFSLTSPYLLYGYPPNALVGPAIVLASARYTLPLVNFQRGILSPPINLGRLSAGLILQAGVVDNLTPSVSIDRGLPLSVGVELHQELVFGYLFGLRARIGVYRGDSRWGGLTQVIFSLSTSE